jgi:DNA primase
MSTVDQIKDRLSITDVISQYIEVIPAGKNFKAKCPFHNEKTPSFFISPDRNSYYCFGCNAKGDIFSFVEQFEGLDFKGALKQLALRAGVELSNYGKEKDSPKDRLYEALEHATGFYVNELNKNKEALAYLTQRGLSRETIELFRVGFAPNEWRSVSNYLKDKGYSDEEIAGAGLTKISDKNNSTGGAYDRFRGRIMFPIADSSGRIIAFSGRILYDDGVQAKYVNSPETILFDKSKVLFGIDKAKFAIRRMNFAIIVEGQMDLILSHQSGFTNTVAVSGTALGDELMTGDKILTNLGLIERLTPNILFALDSDEAGIRAALRSASIGLNLGMDVKIARIPDGKDPADFLLAHTKEEWWGVIKKSEHIVLFQTENVLRSITDEHKRVKAIRETVVPYLLDIGEPLDQAHFVKEVSKRTGVGEEALRAQIKEGVLRRGNLTEVPALENKKTSQAPPKIDLLKRRIQGLYFWQTDSKEPQLSPHELKERIGSIVGREFIEEFLIIDEGKKNEIVFEAEILFGSKDEKSFKEEVDELFGNFEAEYLQDRFSKNMAHIHTAERTGETEKVQQLLAECQSISIRIQQLKNNRTQTYGNK